MGKKPETCDDEKPTGKLDSREKGDHASKGSNLTYCISSIRPPRLGQIGIQHLRDLQYSQACPDQGEARDSPIPPRWASGGG